VVAVFVIEPKYLFIQPCFITDAVGFEAYRLCYINKVDKYKLKFNCKKQVAKKPQSLIQTTQGYNYTKKQYKGEARKKK